MRPVTATPWPTVPDFRDCFRHPTPPPTIARRRDSATGTTPANLAVTLSRAATQRIAVAYFTTNVAALGDLQMAEENVPDVVANFWSVGMASVIR
jgi:hypothetical protein